MFACVWLSMHTHQQYEQALQHNVDKIAVMTGVQVPVIDAFSLATSQLVRVICIFTITVCNQNPVAITHDFIIMTDACTSALFTICQPCTFSLPEGKV